MQTAIRFFGAIFATGIFLLLTACGQNQPAAPAAPPPAPAVPAAQQQTPAQQPDQFAGGQTYYNPQDGYYYYPSGQDFTGDCTDPCSCGDTSMGVQFRRSTADMSGYGYGDGTEGCDYSW